MTNVIRIAVPTALVLLFVIKMTGEARSPSWYYAGCWLFAAAGVVLVGRHWFDERRDR